MISVTKGSITSTWSSFISLNGWVRNNRYSSLGKTLYDETDKEVDRFQFYHVQSEVT